MKIDVKSVVRKHGYTMSEVALALGINRVNLYKSIARTPSPKMLQRIAEVLGCSISEFYVQQPSRQTAMKNRGTSVSENIRRAMLKSGWTMEKLGAQMSNSHSDTLGVTPSSVSTLINGNPTIDKLQEIADIIGISLAELVIDNTKIINGYVKVGETIYEVRSRHDLKMLLDLTED